LDTHQFRSWLSLRVCLPLSLLSTAYRLFLFGLYSGFLDFFLLSLALGCFFGLALLVFPGHVFNPIQVLFAPLLYWAENNFVVASGKLTFLW